MNRNTFCDTESERDSGYYCFKDSTFGKRCGDEDSCNVDLAISLDIFNGIVHRDTFNLLIGFSRFGAGDNIRACRKHGFCSEATVGTVYSLNDDIIAFKKISYG